MAAGINFTGLSSGIDTNAIVEALMAVEARPKTLIAQQQALVEARRTYFNDLSTKLTNLRTLSDGLRTASLFDGAPVTTASDTTRLSASATKDAAAGTYSLQVDRLARANVLQTAASSETAQFGSLYSAAGTYAGGSTQLTALTDAAGTSLGYTDGATITFNSSKDGVPVTAGFAVTATSTVEDLRQFLQTNATGAAVTLEQGGRLKIVSAPGVEQAHTAISLSGPIGAATQTAAATGSNKVASSGTYDISAGGVSIQIAVTAGQTMSDVASAINAKNGSVSATVADGLLRLQSKETGAAQAITVTPGGGATSLGLGEVVAAQDAQFVVDGVTTVTSAKNSGITHGSLSGVTLSLLGTTTSGSPITLTVDPNRLDKDGIKSKIKSFVTAYNDTITSVRDKLSEKKISSPKVESDRVKGMLNGDSSLQRMLSQLRGAISDPVAGLAAGKNAASYAGLTTGAIGQGYTADAVSGKITLDEAKLDAALAAGTDPLEALFSQDGATAGADGLFQRISDLTTSLNAADGAVKSRITGADSLKQTLTERLTRVELQLEAREKRLRAQFTAMESALSNLKAMQASFNSQLAQA
jgi:flagellar hook-associated protein 2